MMGDSLRHLPAFTLWAGVEVAHPVAVALEAVPLQCLLTHGSEVHGRLPERPGLLGLDLEAGDVVGLFLPPELGADASTLPPRMLQARVVWHGPEPGAKRAPGKPTPHRVYLEVFPCR